MESPRGALTGSVSPMVTCSEKRTFTGLDRNFAFLAALIKADFGDCKEKTRQMSSAQPDQACKPRKLPWTGHSSPTPGSDGPKALPLLLEATTSPGEPGWIWPCCSPKDDSQVPAWLSSSELQPTEEERRWLFRAFSKRLSSLQA